MKHEHDINLPEEPIKGEVTHTLDISEDVKTGISRVTMQAKNHFDEHKLVYACAATGVIGFITGKQFRRPIVIEPVFNNTMNVGLEVD